MRKTETHFLSCRFLALPVVLAVDSAVPSGKLGIPTSLARYQEVTEGAQPYLLRHAKAKC